MRALFILGLVVGCSPPPVPDCGLRGNFHRSYVIDTFRVPLSRTDFALDLNGDGRRDNQLGNVLGSAEQAGAQSQLRVDQAISQGLFKPTIMLTSTDPAARHARGAGVVFVDTAGHATFCGSLENGQFVSDDGVSEHRPVELNLRLPFFDDVVLPVTAAHIRFTIDDKRLLLGQLNGASIAKVFVDTALPGVAARLDEKVQSTVEDNSNILSLFDNGGADEGCNGACRNRDGSCGVRGNKRIEQCEVRTNSIIKNVSAPDVDLFDENNQYRPNPDNTGKDSLSMGIGFTAVEVQ
jgi:hypothetical protein